MTADATKMTGRPLGARPNIKKLSTEVTGTVEIATVGGSITYGYDAYLASYRYQLNQLLTGRGGLTLSWVGPYSSGTAPATATHSIIGASVKSFGPGAANDMETSPRNLGTTYTPDLLIVEPIVNTANDAGETVTWAADCSAAIIDWAGLVSGMRFVILGKFDAGDDARRTRIDTIIAAWDGMLTTLDGAGLSDRYVPIKYSSIAKDVDQTTAEVIGNRVHWNDRGQAKVACDLFPAVMNALGKNAVW